MSVRMPLHGVHPSSCPRAPGGSPGGGATAAVRSSGKDVRVIQRRPEVRGPCVANV